MEKFINLFILSVLFATVINLITFMGMYADGDTTCRKYKWFTMQFIITTAMFVSLLLVEK